MRIFIASKRTLFYCVTKQSNVILYMNGMR